jgi:hypothetical protein
MPYMVIKIIFMMCHVSWGVVSLTGDDDDDNQIYLSE